jgi:cobalt-zinc-cadmium efflux system outer membrane protein
MPAVLLDAPARSGQRGTKTGSREIAPTTPVPKERRRPFAPRELPEEVDDEPSDGLALEAALERLLVANRDLAVKYQDIPKARADILSAGLIENPSVFLDSEGIPYGNYSPQKPGETQYAPTIVQPFDVSGKRRKRVRVAERAERVLEALYQDAVRQEIDKLYNAHVDFLAARLNVKTLQGTVTALTALAATAKDLASRGLRPSSEVTEASLRRASAETALREAETTLLQARRQIAVLLAVPPAQADHFHMRGVLHDCFPPPPATEELIQLALRTRPDLAAYQLSVERAHADVQLAQAERFDDVLVFYTPYQGTTFPSQGKQTATGWETGALTVLPIFERNQGEIARAKVNVTQLEIQREGLRREIVQEVQRAATEHAVSRAIVRRYECEILPELRALRDGKSRLAAEGGEEFDSFLSVERDYQEAVHQYLEALVRHRRSMLRLNTVVGQRILP